jgi:hypothetical protein
LVGFKTSERRFTKTPTAAQLLRPDVLADGLSIDFDRCRYRYEK